MIINVADAIKGKEIILLSTLEISGNVEIYGNSIILTSLRGNNIHILSSADVVFHNLRITHLIIDQHGAIYNQGHLTLHNCEIDNNHADYNGGAIANDYGYLFIDQSTIHDNTATGNGAGIYNYNGGSVVVSNNSVLYQNTALNNGGGIYSLLGQVSLYDSQVQNNTAGTTNGSSTGGGIHIQNASLNVIRSTITGNIANGSGGGLAIMGGLATIDTSTISANTSINGHGGGITVESNTENSYPARITLVNMQVTNKPITNQYVGENFLKQTDQQASKNAIISNPDIFGTPLNQNEGPDRVSYVNDSNPTPIGNPPTLGPQPEQLKNYLGVVDINAFCQSAGFVHGEIDNKDSSLIDCTTQTDTGKISNNSITPYPAVNACKWRYAYNDTIHHIVDRLADYYDPSSLQCYKDVEMISIVNNKPFSVTNSDGLNNFCINKDYVKLQDKKDRSTAYEWDCMDKEGYANGVSITEACRFLTPYKDAFDRLADFNRPNGWECWHPIS